MKWSFAGHGVFFCVSFLFCAAMISRRGFRASGQMMAMRWGGKASFRKCSKAVFPLGQRARNMCSKFPVSGHEGRPPATRRGVMVRVTGATPKTSPFQSTTPPAGLVSMRISIGVGKGSGAGRQIGSGSGLAQEHRAAARAKMDAGLMKFFIPRKIFVFLDQKAFFQQQRGRRVSNPK
jgi:hypothetical protein